VDEWTKQRTCTECGKPFTLSDHGHTRAQSAAQSLEQGTLDPAALPEVVTKCPACCGASRMSDEEALIAALRVEHEMRGTYRKELYSYARLIGAMLTLISIVGLIMVRAYSRLRPGQYPPGRLYSIVMVIFLAAGVCTYVWAFLQSGRGGK